MVQTAPVADNGPSKPLPGAKSALALLLLINLFNFLDRQVIAAVEPEIRSDILAGDPLAEFKTGLLWFAFLITYMVIAPLFGYLADRMSRWWLVGIGLLVWTVASGSSGIDWLWLGTGATLAYVFLFISRCLVGVGEGAYGPVAPAMLSDLYPVADRGKVMAWFYLAIPVGGALGYSLGGIVVNVLGWSWHWAFYLVVPPGLVLAVLCFFMKEPPRGKMELTQPVEHQPTRLADYLDLFRIPSYFLNLVGMTCMTFAIGGLAFWLPSFLESRGVKHVELPMMIRIEARTFLGAIVALAGLIATLAGGAAGDALRKWNSGSYFLVSGISMILGFPMVVAALVVPFPWAWLFIFVAVFSLFFNTAPTNAINANVTHPSVRASAFALNIFIIHTFGDALSPPLIGLLTSLTGRLEVGFVLVSLLMLVGGAFWIAGAKHLQRDTELAPTRVRMQPARVSAGGEMEQTRG